MLDHLPAILHLVLATRTRSSASPLPISRSLAAARDPRPGSALYPEKRRPTFCRMGMGLPLSEEEVLTLAAAHRGLDRRPATGGTFPTQAAGSAPPGCGLRGLPPLSAGLRAAGYSRAFALVAPGLSAPDLDLYPYECGGLPDGHCAPGEPLASSCWSSWSVANLFVVPLDEQRQWYRFHDLFREALRARLHASQPELVPSCTCGRPGIMRRRASCGRRSHTRWPRLTTPLPPP